MSDDGKITIKTVLDDSGVSDGVDKISNACKKGLTATTAAITAITTAAAAGAAAIIKKSIENFAEYEQLVGGVETLFKDSSDTIMEYAQNAYQTAGLSANQYMETVTSFSASLLQSLKKDTEAASEYANMAIVDMSDNANKMGSSMESIQNAYQGFAKQNYTMLDNLKLGYGGTKEEMARLLEDATKLSGVEYDIKSFADIVEAIHVVQTELGITGTTAKEASSTIQGSVGMMKSAWENLATGLADPSQDIGELAGKLIDSVVTVGDNIIPVIKELAPRLVSGLKDLAQGVAEEIEPLLGSLGFGVFKKIIDPLRDTIQTLYQYFSGAGEKTTTLIGTVQSLIPVIAGAAAAFAAFKTAMLIADTIDGVKKALDGASLAQAALNSVMNLNPAVLATTAIVGLTAALTAYCIEISKTNEVNQAVADRIDEINTGITAQSDAYDRLKETVEANAGARDAEIEHAQTLFEELQNICDETGKVKKGEEDRAKFIVDTLNEALGTNIEIIGGQIQGYKNLQDEIAKTIEQEKMQILLEGQKELYAEAVKNLSEAKKNERDATYALSDAEKNLSDAIKHRNELAEEANGRPWVNTVDLYKADKAIEDARQNVLDSQRALADSKEVYKNYSDEIAKYEDAATLAAKGKTDEVIKLLTSETTAYETATKDKSKELNKQKENAAQAYSDALVDLKNYNDDFGDSEDKRHQDEIKRLTEQAVEAKKAAETVGVSIVDGMIEGIGSKGDELNRTVERMINSIPEESRKLLDIHSPSRVMRNDIGKNIPLGVAAGVADETDAVIDEMKRMYDDVEKVQPLDPKKTTIGGVTLPDNFFAKGKAAAEDFLSGFISAMRDVNFAVNAIMGGMTPTLAVAGAGGAVQRTESYSETITNTKVVVEAKGDLLDYIAVKQYEGGDKID